VPRVKRARSKVAVGMSWATMWVSRGRAGRVRVRACVCVCRLTAMTWSRPTEVPRDLWTAQRRQSGTSVERAHRTTATMGTLTDRQTHTNTQTDDRQAE
jgi:hypothetical protein